MNLRNEILSEAVNSICSKTSKSFGIDSKSTI